ncbi:MAG: S1 RNA-binding domain-containing protein [Cellulosilyticum sp.]|nr:S1 RNA-binding domain-containing protein [Cellulosilyticum sp.]
MSEKFQVGQIIEGTVTGIKPFGAFVSLDATTQGLVHISHITHGYLENINDAIKVGDTVKVKILSIDSEKGKISLSIKETQEKPRPASRPSSRPNNSKPPKKETSVGSFEDLMKDFLKVSNDRQADINKRLNR